MSYIMQLWNKYYIIEYFINSEGFGFKTETQIEKYILITKGKKVFF